MLHEAISRYEAGQSGEEANLPNCCAPMRLGRLRKCAQTYGGFGFAEEYDIERKFREARLIRLHLFQRI